MGNKILDIKSNMIEKVLVYFMLIQPILDALTTICIDFISPVLTVGILVRTIFLVTSSIAILFLVNKEDRKKIIIYYACVAVYCLTYLFNMYTLHGTNLIVTQIKGLIKVIYFPIILVDLYYLYKNKKIILKEDILSISLLGYTLIIFCCKYLGIAYRTYKYGYNVGTVGLFYSANEIGAIICMLFPFLLYIIIKEKKFNIFITISLLLATFSVLEMGTKVPYLGLVLAIFVVIFIFAMKKIFKDDSYNFKYVKYSAIFLIALYLVTGYTPLGENLNAVYGKIFPRIQIKKQIETNKRPSSKPIESLEDFQTAAVSGRDLYMQQVKENYTNSNVRERLFGIGYIKVDNDGDYSAYKLVEMDYFDIFFSHGIIGTLIVFTPFVSILFSIALKVFKNIKKVLVNEKIILNTYSVGITLIIALLAGHVFVSPAVSIYIVMTLLILLNKLEELETK